MKHAFLIAAATLALAGCSKANNADEATAPTAPTAPTVAEATPVATPNAAGTTTMTAESVVGTWDDTMADGTKSTTEFRPDGTLTDTDAKGVKTTAKYVVKDGKVCITDDAGKEAGKEHCWAVSAAQADGSMTATSDAGTVLTVKKRPA